MSIDSPVNSSITALWDWHGRHNQVCARHISLPDVGLDGQRKINDAKVLVIGAGGLGSPVLLYLAAAGIGKIGIIDDDVVDLTNLQRQIIHSQASIGKNKAMSAIERINSLNPSIETQHWTCRLGPNNADEIFQGWDLVIDGTDNIPTRYLIDTTCQKLGIPWIYGSIYRFEGQVSVFNYRGDHHISICFPNRHLPIRSPLVQTVVFLEFFLE